MIETERLILRGWRAADAPAMQTIGRDPRAMELIGPLMSMRRARELVDGQRLNQSLFGHCFWAIERRSDRRLLGYCGLNVGPAGTPAADGIEIGWLLARDAWGQAYAQEAAEASLTWGWANLDVSSIVAMTVPANRRSRGLMERLGMTRFPAEDFDHPALAEGDPLRRHVVYRIQRPLGL